MSNKRVVFLSGGTGTPKLLNGQNEFLKDYNVTVIGNTGDDWSFYGLHVSPDVDAVLYTLANLIDLQKWWGIKNDTFHMVRFLQDYLKEDIWFNLGDFDTSVCLLRTHLLEKGLSLTETTKKIQHKLNIPFTILPMVDQPIKTIVETTDGIFHLQEFWVKNKGQGLVKDVRFEGNLNQTTTAVLESIETADKVIIGPSNPVSSIGPILSINPIKKSLKANREKVVAISPIIGDAPISGPTGKFLSSWNQKISPLAIPRLYGDLFSTFMIDSTDKSLIDELKELGITPLIENIIMKSEIDSTRILTKILKK